MKLGVRHALGSDSQAQIDPLEDARELDYHLRLAQQQRAVLDQIDGRPIAARLFDCATTSRRAGVGHRVRIAAARRIRRHGFHRSERHLRCRPHAGNPSADAGLRSESQRDPRCRGERQIHSSGWTTSAGRGDRPQISAALSQSVGRRQPQRERPLTAVVDHLSNLIRIPSVSAMSNRAITDYASCRLHGPRMDDTRSPVHR